MKCPACHGTGRNAVFDNASWRPSGNTNWFPCDYCKGKGATVTKCNKCGNEFDPLVRGIWLEGDVHKKYGICIPCQGQGPYKHVYDLCTCTARYQRCYICERGELSCKVCRGFFRDELTTDCPGEEMTIKERKKVRMGEIDFIQGEWVVKANKESK